MVYSAAGNDIYAWRRGCELKHTYKGGLISKSNFNLVLKKLFGCHFPQLTFVSPIFKRSIFQTLRKNLFDQFFAFEDKGQLISE